MHAWWRSSLALVLAVLPGCMAMRLNIGCYVASAPRGSSSRIIHRHHSSSSSSSRCGLPRAAAPDDESTDWEDAMASLKKRQAAMNPEAGEGALPPPAEPTGTEGSPPPAPSWLKAESTAPPAPSSSGFRYERKDDTKGDDFIAGLDDRDQALVRNAILYGGRTLTFITLASLAFYIYIGISGGITDGFDRFSEPIEDIRDTRAREGTDVF